MPCAPPGLPDGPIARVPFGREGGYAGGQRLLAARNRPTAVFASSDLQAVGLLKAIREHGLSVPDDIAVVSFDGTDESEYCSPPLTGGAAAHPRDGHPGGRPACSPTTCASGGTRSSTMELVVRESCGCPQVKEVE